MDIFLLQLLLSFFFGGFIVAFQAFLAEKAPTKLAGIIVSLPSTIIVNLLFLGLVLTAKDFASLLGVLPAPLGLSFGFIWLYIQLAQVFEKYFQSKKLFIVLITSFALILWLISAVVLFKFSIVDFWISFLIYLIFIVLVQASLQRKVSRLTETGFQLQYTKSQQAFRIVFAGFMVAMTVYLGKTLGPFWGGIMVMFPAAYSSTLILIHYYHNTNKVVQVFSNSALGSSSLILYAILAHYLFPLCGVYLGTIVTVLVSLLYAWFLAYLFEHIGTRKISVATENKHV